MTEEFEAKRRDILEGASEVFMRRGFSAGTTKEIAAKVGLSQPAIYHYVGSKADLLREIALHVDRDMLAALDNGLGSAADPADQLRGVIEEYTAAVVCDRRSFAVFWQEQYSLGPEIRDKIAADERHFVGKVGGLVEALQKRGQLPEGPPLLLARSILSMPSYDLFALLGGGARPVPGVGLGLQQPLAQRLRAHAQLRASAFAHAYAVGYSGSRSSAIRTARSCCLAGYFFPGTINILVKRGSGTKPGTVHLLQS